MLKNNIQDLIGSTPLYELKNIERDLGLNAKIYAKLEYFNLTGSIKDRIAFQMLEDARKDGKIKDGATIIEPTSGNTGIGIAAISASLGYKAIIVMPDSMTKERIDLMKCYGAEVVLTEGKYGMQGAVNKAIELNNSIPNSFIPSQFENMSNPKAHYLNTAKELVADLGKDIDYVIAGIGTGGTISGIAANFKELGLKTEFIGVEPENSPLITKGQAGKHKIQGIGANFIPHTLNLDLVTKVETSSDEGALEMTKMLAKREGVLVGISSGAALNVAVRIAKDNPNKKIVIIFPDSGSRYLSILSE